MAFCEGVLEKVGIWPLDKEDNYGNTHRFAIVMKGDKCPDGWIGIGNKKKVDGRDLNWWDNKGKQVILEGSKLEFMFTVSDNGFKNMKNATLEVIENGTREPASYGYHKASKDGEKTQGSGNTTSTNNEDYATGMKKGNSFNCSLILCKNKPQEPNFVDYAKQIYKINNEVQAETKVNGATCGMSVIAACKITMDITKVKDMALSLIHSHIKEIGEWVDGGCEDTPKTVDDKPKTEGDPPF